MSEAESFVGRTLNFWAEQMLSPGRGAVEKDTSSSIFGIGLGKSKTHLKAFTIYMKVYGALKDSGSLSETVESLSTAVMAADNLACLQLELMGKMDAIGEIARSEDARRIAGEINLEIFRAAGWLRRFAEDRAKLDVWFDSTEKATARDLQVQLETATKSLSAALRVSESSSPSLTDDEEMLQANKDYRRILQHKIENLMDTARSLMFYVRELEDIPDVSEGLQSSSAPKLKDNSTTYFSSRRAIGEGEDTAFKAKSSSDLIKEAKAILKALDIKLMDANPPAWRDGPNVDKGLGPFGVEPIEEKGVAFEFITTDIQELYSPYIGKKQIILPPLNGEYMTIPRGVWMSSGTDTRGSDQLTGVTNRGAKLTGALSPLCEVTIPPSDPTFDFIRIPKNAAFFAWAYPLSQSSAEEFARAKQKKPDAIDLFLLLGGYVYFDKKLNFIRANALLPAGSQLQFSSPYQLTQEMHRALVEAKRFQPVTLDFLKAKYFAWVLPGEFDNQEEHGTAAFPSGHPGAFAYCYDHSLAHTDRDNAFILAAVDSELR